MLINVRLVILLYGVNAFAASLAFANIVLYAGVYTPLKRVHPINTWYVSLLLLYYFIGDLVKKNLIINRLIKCFNRVGSIVGAVPPGMFP